MGDLDRKLTQHLADLRRYARAVEGDRKRGDANVRCCLERLLRDGSCLEGRDVRLLLYRTLHQVWRTSGVRRRPCRAYRGPVTDQAIVAARLRQLEPSQRQILALVALEGFSLSEAAAVMGCSRAAAEALLGQAKEELCGQRATRVLIIEDEPVIALDIAATIEQSGHTVVGIAATHREAVEVATREDPELILADIKLADDSSGVAAVREIVAGHTVSVVFITAFPDRLVTEDRPEPIYLVTKPFDPRLLRVSISQALAARQAGAVSTVRR